RLRGDVTAGVLRVVHDDVRALQELGVTLVALMREVARIEEADRTISAPPWVRIHLVVRRVDERGRADGRAVADAWRGVVEELRVDADTADGEVGLVDLDEVEARGERRERDREVRVVHRPADRLRKRAVHAGRAVDRDLAARRER